MIYLSTRGAGPVSFEEVLLQGLGPDGGLYVPRAWPVLADATPSQSYQDIATDVATAFGGEINSRDDWAALIRDAYADFAHPDIAPLRELEPGLFLLELFHGPTCAFKDFAMQVLARAFDQVLRRRKMRRTILVATSGDTGAAAVEALKGLQNLSLVVLHPKGRISDVQRRQMTTCDADNVRNVAIDGSFDDCQRIVKRLFGDEDLREGLGLGAVNSINWVRIVAQIPYFIYAAAQLGEAAAFSVPTGNFGDIFAAYAARRMGLATGPLVIATNANDILHRTLQSGIYKPQSAQATHSPAMDIQIASNFERLLFDVLGGDADRLTPLMAQLQNDGEMHIPGDALDAIREVFLSARVSDAATRLEIKDAHDRYGVLIDPHTAVGLRAARQTLGDISGPKVVLATAHAAKFPDTIVAATGLEPPIPARLEAAMTGAERFVTLAATFEAVKGFLKAEMS